MLQITVLFASLYVVIIDKIFIQHMNSYLLTEIQLVENGYPRPSGEPGVASIVRKPDDVNDIKPVGPNGMHTHTHARTHARTRTHTHTHAHIHTHAHYMHAHICAHRTQMHLTSIYLQRYKIFCCTQLKDTHAVVVVSLSSSTTVVATRALRSVVITLRGYRKGKVYICLIINSITLWGGRKL